MAWHDMTWWHDDRNPFHTSQIDWYLIFEEALFTVAPWTKTGHSLVGLLVCRNTFYTLADDLELAMMWMSRPITEHSLHTQRATTFLMWSHLTLWCPVNVWHLKYKNIWTHHQPSEDLVTKHVFSLFFPWQIEFRLTQQRPVMVLFVNIQKCTHLHDYELWRNYLYLFGPLIHSHFHTS